MSLTHVVNTDPDNKYEPYNAANPMPVSVSGGLGDATAANQLLGNASLSNIDTNIVACDTGNMSGTVAVSAVAGSVAITSAGTLNVADSTAQSSLANIDTAVSGTLDVADSTAQSSLANIDTAVSGTLMVEDGTAQSSLASIDTAVSGTLLTKLQSVANKGSAFNAANNVTINFGAYSSVVGIENMNKMSIFYEDSLALSRDTLMIEVSPDGTNYFEYVELYPSDAPSGLIRTANMMDVGAHGLTHLRLKNASVGDNYTNVKATVVGSP